MRALALVAALLLSACTTSYKHLSSPSTSNDGYDLVCAGVEVEKWLRVSGNYCRNVAANGGEFVLIDVTYRWAR